MGNGPIPKDLFIGLERVAHLCVGGEAPMLKSSIPAVSRFLQLKSTGMAGREQFVAECNQTKTLLASYLGVTGDRLAFLGHASDGMNVLASGMALQPGDEVLTLRNEYPSVLLPWLARRDQGIVVNAVEPGRDPDAAIEEGLTDRTRVVAVSYVSYLTGHRLDLPRLSAAVHERNAILAVDVSHALGVVPIPISECDVAVSCCYKFLLGTHGLGIFYWNSDRVPELAQSSVGWHSIGWPWPSIPIRSSTYTLKEGAERFELGNPPYISIFVLRQALEILMNLDPAETERWVWGLGDQLREGLVDLGLDVWTPAQHERRGPNIVFAAGDPDALVERLRQRQVLAWSGDERVRFSIHGYNDSEDIEAALLAVSEAIR